MTDKQLQALLLPPSPTSPDTGRQRTIQLGRGAAAPGDGGAAALPWATDKAQQVPALQKSAAGGQRLRLPKRRTMSAGRTSISPTLGDSAGSLPGGKCGLIPESPGESGPHRAVDFGGARSPSVSLAGTLSPSMSLAGTLSPSMSLAGTLSEEPFPYVTKSAAHSRSGSSIAISASSRVSLNHRLSQSSQHIVPGRPSTSRTMPISVRPRFNSAMSSFRPGTAHQRQASGVEEFGGAELTIRLSVDASQSRNYRMLVAGDTVLADLRMLEDENQRVVSPAQAGLGTKLIALYFGASWSADCDAFAPQLQGLAAAHHDDLAVVHVSMDNHPADMARTMAGSGWLGVPWSEHGLRQALAKRLEVAATELPRLVIVDGHSHHIISPSARTDVERRPLSCVREWKKSRAGLTWWNRVKPW